MVAAKTQLFVHPVLGFSFEVPASWKIVSWNRNTSDPAYGSQLQKSADDLPQPGDVRYVLVMQEVLANEYDRIRCSVELTVWKDEPFKLPTRAKKYPCGELAFKARIGTYGRGGEHAAGQLDLGDGLVMHIVVSTDEPSATVDTHAVLATGKLVPRT
jgi:hypothetical protein